jgi:hypothetical protein
MKKTQLKQLIKEEISNMEGEYQNTEELYNEMYNNLSDESLDSIVDSAIQIRDELNIIGYSREDILSFLNNLLDINL